MPCAGRWIGCDMTDESERTDGLRRIAVVVVNYGTANLTIAGVQSVLDRTHGGRTVSVHVLDNASPGDDAAQFAAAHEARGWGGRVVLRAETTNHGFGGGCNHLIEPLLSRGAEAPDAVMLLNPDAQLAGEAVDALASALEADPQAGFAGAGIALPDGRPVTAAFRFPSVASEFADTLAFGPVTRRFGDRVVALPPNHPGGPVDWVAGAAVMIRAATLRETGLFDPAFFLYYEEVDLMRRAALMGWRTLYVPEARVVHAEGAASGIRSSDRVVPRRPAYHYRSWALYHRKARGRWGGLLAAAARLAGAGGNQFLGLLPGRRSGVAAHFGGDFLRHALAPMLRSGPDPRGGERL